MEQQKFVKKNKAFADAQRRNENKRTRRTVFYIFLLVFVSVVFLAVCAAVFLKVDQVNINGSERYSYDEIRALVPITEGENIYSFDSDDIEESILKAFPYIKTVEVKRDLPTSVEINIVEEQPYFVTELAEDAYILTSDLKVLERHPDKSASEFDLVILDLNNVRECIVGNKVKFVNDRTLNAVAELYKCMEENYITDKITSIDIRSRFDIYMNYDNRFTVYVGNTEDIDIKIRFLVAIIDELDENATGEIDISDPHEAPVALT